MSLNEIKSLIRKFMADHELYSKDADMKNIWVSDEFYDFKVSESTFCCIPIGCIRAMKWKKEIKEDCKESIVINNKV
jgi:hypothetical protein